MRNVKVGLSYGGLFYPNLGCCALTYSTLQALEEVGQKLDLEFEYLLRANYDVNNVYIPEELRGFPITFLDKNSLPRTVLKNLLRRNFSDLMQFKELKSCQFFVDVVGGDSFSDIYGMDRITRLHKDFKQLSFLKKKVILLPQTIGPYQSKAANAMADEIMQQAAYVYARDKLSYDVARRFVPAEKVELSVDMALFMGYQPRPRSEKNRVIGINPSGLLWHGGYTRNNQFGLKEDYQTLLRRLIRSILEKSDFEVELVPHVLTGNYAFNIEDDYHACRELKKEFPACRLAPFFYTPIEAKSYISGLDALLGSRMHCCIAAYSSGVPVFPLAYSRKFRGMFQKTLDYGYSAELTEETADAVLQKVGEFLGHLGPLQGEMARRVATLREHKERFIDSLSCRISTCLQSQ